MPEVKHNVHLKHLQTTVSDGGWSKSRRNVAVIVDSRACEVFLSIAVLCSIAIAITEADHKAIGETAPPWTTPVEHILLVVYCVEMVSRIYVLRKQFFMFPFHLCELGIVLIDATFALLRLTSLELSSISFLRALRLVKLFRAFHVLKSQPALKFFMDAFASSMQTMLFGCFFIAIALVIFGILAVEFLNPLQVEFSSTCTRCPEAFMSVYESMAALFQTVIMGDEWAELFRPYLARYQKTVFIIAPIFMILHLGLLNLIMAGIVDAANQARETNFRKQAEDKEKEYERLEKKFQSICQEMDNDQSGSVTLAELLSGYENHPEFRTTLNAMDIKEKDLASVFEILDGDGSGDVQYSEFVKELHKMRSSDSHTMLVLIKHYATDIQRMVKQELLFSKKEVAGGMSQLAQDVRGLMTLLQTNIENSEKALEVSNKALEVAVRQGSEFQFQEQKPLQHDTAFCGQVPKGAVNSFTPEATPANPNAVSWAQNSVVCSQLQSVSEQVEADLEDLRRRCEQSAVRLSTFRSLLPYTTKSTQQSLRETAKKVGAGQSFGQEAQQEISALWNPCCTAPLRSHGRGGPPPEHLAITTQFIGTQSDSKSECAVSPRDKYSAYIR